MTLRPCLVCGEPSEANRCTEHRGTDSKQSTTERGYDQVWRRLSERARRLQPWCSDCYATDDLTTDHSPEAWRRRAAGKRIRLRDVEVVCRGCNGRRGRARPVGGDPALDPSPTRQQPHSPSHTTPRSSSEVR